MRTEVILAHYHGFSLKKYNDIIRVFGSAKNFWDSGDTHLLGWRPKQLKIF